MAQANLPRAREEAFPERQAVFVFWPARRGCDIEVFPLCTEGLSFAATPDKMNHRFEAFAQMRERLNLPENVATADA